MTHKPPQGIDAPNCAHKELKKQMVGEFVYYVCECGQKFRIELWDGKVSVLAPPDPRKDLAARLESLSIGHRSVSMRWKGKHDPAMEDVCESCGATWAHHAGFVCLETGCKMDCPRCQLEALVAEMRGAKR